MKRNIFMCSANALLLVCAALLWMMQTAFAQDNKGIG